MKLKLKINNMGYELSEEAAFEEAKIVFKKSEDREPNMNLDKDMLVVSALQLGIQYGYEMGYSKYYTPMCDRCEYRSATCFGPGAYCDECSMELADEEDEE